MATVTNFVNAVLACKAASKDAEKVKALSNLDDVAKRLFVEALSPYRVFGVKKYDEPTAFDTVDDSAEIFFKLLDDLASRKLTGKAAREAVTNALEGFTKRSAEVLAMVIDKNLRMGASESTLNKLYPDLVPTFAVMLAAKVDEKYQWKFPLLAEAKYDGERTIAVCNHGAVTYFSRSGKEATHVDGLFDDDMRAIEKLLGYPVVVDGERYASNFTETINAKKSGNDSAKAALRLHAFDYMALSNWERERCVVTNFERRKHLETILKQASCTKIVLTKGKIVNSVAEATKFYNEMLTEKFEGLILKQVNSMYEWKRGKSWHKWKPVIDLDGKVTGFYEGRPGTKYVGTLGGITIEGEDENGNKFECDCGSGFKDEERHKIWANRKKYLGMTVQIEAQELSESEGRPGIYSARFPTFQRFRTDK